MFALVHNKRVLAGPMDWNRGIFAMNLEKLKINFALPRVAPKELPLVIDENTAVYEVEDLKQGYNLKTQYLYGPVWMIGPDKATATYEVRDKPVEFVKGELKREAAQERYRREQSGAKVTIQGVEVTVDTTRGARDVFVQKFLLMGADDTVKWKFPEGWFTLTKEELGQVVAAGVEHVQAAFDWEAAKVEEIDAAINNLTLDNIVITEREERRIRRMLDRGE